MAIRQAVGHRCAGVAARGSYPDDDHGRLPRDSPEGRPSRSLTIILPFSKTRFRFLR